MLDLTYPATIDKFAGQGHFSQQIYPPTINAIHESIGNIETELGTDVAGVAESLKTRLSNSLIENVKDYGAKGDGTTDDLAAISNAITALSGSGDVRFPKGTYLISDDLTVADGIRLVFESGAKIKIADTKTLTINGSVETGLFQIFEYGGASSAVVFGDGSVEKVPSHWWGAKGDGSIDSTVAIQAAVNALPSGGIVSFPQGTYVFTSITLPQNITLQGVGWQGSVLQGTAAGGTMIKTGTGTRKWGVRLRDLRIEATNYNIAVDWADVSNGEVSGCYISGADYGLVIQNQAYFNQIINNRIDSVEVGVRFKAGVDADDAPNGNYLYNLNIYHCKTGIHIEPGWSGGNNIISGGYFSGNNIALKLDHGAQKVFGLGAEGNGGGSFSTASTTTYTPTTVADSTAWDLSGVSEGMVVIAAGNMGVVTDIDDANNILTVDGWAPSQPADGIVALPGSAGIVITSPYNSVIGVYMGGGFVTGHCYIVDVSGANTVLSAYQFGTNRIGVGEASQYPLTLARSYSTGNPGLLPILDLVNEGPGTPGMLRGTMDALAGNMSEFITMRRNETKVFQLFCNGVIQAGQYTTYADTQANRLDTIIAAPDSERISKTGSNYTASNTILRAGWMRKIVSNGYGSDKKYYGGNLILGAGSAENVAEYGRTYGNIIFRRYSDGATTYEDIANTEDTNIDLTSTGANEDTEWIARKFTAEYPGYVESVTLKMGKTGSPAGTIEAYIYTDDGGSPSKPDAQRGGASDSVTCNDLSSDTDGGDVTFTWTSDHPWLPLLDGQSKVFWVVIKSTGYTYADGVTEVRWRTEGDTGGTLNECAKYDADAGTPWTIIAANSGADVSIILLEHTDLGNIDGRTAEMTLEGDIAATGGYKQPFNFMQSDVAANQTAIAIDVCGLSGNTEYVMSYDGSVLGISIASNDARTAGTLIVDVTVNGTATGLQAQVDGTNTQYHSATQAKDTDSFSAGDRIGVKITTDGTWAPVTADIVVTVIVEM